LKEVDSVQIGITDTLKPNLAFYTSWLKRLDPSIEFTVLSPIRQNVELVDSVGGLLLTGGGDIDPRYFGVKDSLARAKDVNASRDEFEFYVIERALDRNIPILGICRGMQTMNVYLGGSLILDLPSAGYEDHSREKRYQLDHQVEIELHSLLYEIAGINVLNVNSSHHQAVDRPGNGLMVSGRSNDGVVEAAEWILKDRMPFLLLVQWHPERMEKEFEGPASKSLAERFLKEVKNETIHKPSTTASQLEE
jgi:putative glutamine amidotransferase